MAPTHQKWQALLDQVSHDDVHGSWRRATLLALVRSERANEVLTRASAELLDNDGAILRELIRIVIAVDVQPASQILTAAGLDPATIPASINAPSGPSWHRLISWILSLGEGLPSRVIPEVVELYTAWSIGMFGFDPLTPMLLTWLYKWLNEIEVAYDIDLRYRRARFDGVLDRESIRALESQLRTGFLAFCNREPNLAVRYLRSVGERCHNEKIVRSILNFRGSLAQAAPGELAELTATALISKPGRGDHHSRRERDEPFGYLDHLFFPASPSQGPFLELLVHAPQFGLQLIRRLVDHAISFYSNGNDYGDDVLLIALPEGIRAFPWQRSYAWSREGEGANCVSSALMALEAWAHRRIEAGEDVDTVLLDVLGSSDAPAAYLLVVVDLLLSHWPASRESAIPFAACPELLCIDRERHLHDHTGYTDILGLKALQKEPLGIATVSDLKNRVSRRTTLSDLLSLLAFEAADFRNKLTRLLRDAATRLGAFDVGSDLGDPRLLVTHALNVADPNNWREVSMRQEDGRQNVAREYVPPEAERAHLAPLQEAARDSLVDANMSASLHLALDDPSRSSPQLASAAVTWAQGCKIPPEHTNAENDWGRAQVFLAAAMIVMRDGDDELRAEHSEWAHRIFAEALHEEEEEEEEEDSVYRFRTGIRYNPIATAFVGIAHALRDRASVADSRNLLKVAVRHERAAAHGFGAVANVLASFDERLPRAIMRCAFQACIRPTHTWETSREDVEARSERRMQRLNKAIDAEIAWLKDEGSEPGWPEFPSEPLRPRRRIRLPGGRRKQETPSVQQLRPEEHVDHQAAALWLSNSGSPFDVRARRWLLQIARIYGPWTSAANGTGLEVHEEIDHPPSEWNRAYFSLLAHCISELTTPEVEELALAPVTSLPDEPFFDVGAEFLRSIDSVYFSDHRIDEAVAISIRSELARRLMKSNGWKRLAGSPSASIESHIGPVISVLFFKRSWLHQAY